MVSESKRLLDKNIFKTFGGEGFNFKCYQFLLSRKKTHCNKNGLANCMVSEMNFNSPPCRISHLNIENREAQMDGRGISFSLKQKHMVRSWLTRQACPSSFRNNRLVSVAKISQIWRTDRVKSFPHLYQIYRQSNFLYFKGRIRYLNSLFVTYPWEGVEPPESYPVEERAVQLGRSYL